MMPADLVLRHVLRAGVPPRFAGCRFATFTARQGTARALAAAREIGASSRPGLVLCGPPGTGKTHLAAAMVADRIERWLADWPEAVRLIVDPERGEMAYTRPDQRIRLVSVPGFLDRLRLLIRFADAADPLPELIAADLVVLDDLGREKVTDWASERLYVLVNERYNALRPTVVTSNYSPQELVERGYDAVVSRLVEGVGAVLISATDYRSEAI